MFIRAFGNFFLFAFALDAAISLIDDLARMGGFAGLSGLRTSIALLVLLAAPGVALGMACSRALPARVFLPPLLLSVWVTLGAAPIQIFFDDAGIRSLALSGLQAMVAAATLMAVHFASESRGWTLEDSPERPADFAPLRLLGFGAAFVLLGPLTLGAYLVLGITTVVHQGTAGFIHFDSTGIHLVERHYQRDDAEIRLIGMMHVAREGTYEKLFDSFGEEGSVVLEEGVSDEHDVLADRLPYDALVQPLGLTRQVLVSKHFSSDSSDEKPDWPVVKRADLDASEFSPETLHYLKGLDEAMVAFEERDYLTMSSVLQRPEMQGPNAQMVMNDILVRRDAYLSEQLEEALREYTRVVVPWGALHLVKIEKDVLAWGFRETASTRHLAIEWGELWEALQAFMEAERKRSR